MGLTAKHREQLHGRGLTDEQIDQRGFKSVDRYQEFNLIPINPMINPLIFRIGIRIPDPLLARVPLSPIPGKLGLIGNSCTVAA